MGMGCDAEETSGRYGVYMKKKVYIAVASRHFGHWGMFTGLLHGIAYASQKDYLCSVAPTVGDSLICRARQEILHAFLETDYDYLFSLDDDIQMPPQTIPTLVETEKDIIAGVYRLKNDSGKCALRGIESFKLGDFPNQVKEVMYVSTGCMLISRRAAEKMWNSYPELEYLCNMPGEHRQRRAVYSPFIYKQEYLSEDWAFCQRAIDIGFKIYIHTGIQCGHWGLQCYEPSEEN
jgi:hypothetical protein